MVAYEGHSGTTIAPEARSDTTDAVFTVDLACAYENALSVDYLSYDE